MNQEEQANLQNEINRDDGGWTKHSDRHWSRTVRKSKLDYWPHIKKFQYEGKTRKTDVYQFIKVKSGNHQITNVKTHI